MDFNPFTPDSAKSKIEAKFPKLKTNGTTEKYCSTASHLMVLSMEQTLTLKDFVSVEV